MPVKTKTGRTLSTSDHAVRMRMRRQNANAERDLPLLLKKPLEEWDLEELARGRTRDRNGKFKGRPPIWITPLVIAEAKRRFQILAKQEMAIQVKSAIQVVVNVMTCEDTDDNGKPLVDARTRLDAAKFLIEHVLGKASTKVEIEADDTVRTMLASALVLPDGNDAHPVVDGQFTIEDEDDDGQ